MANVFPDYSITSRFGESLNRGRDVSNTVPSNGRLDTLFQAKARSFYESLNLRGYATHGNGYGAVPMVVVYYSADVNAHNVALTDDPVSRYAVHYLFVEGDTDCGRESTIALERGPCAETSYLPVGYEVKILGLHSGLNSGKQGFYRGSHDLSSLAHALQLLRRFYVDSAGTQLYFVQQKVRHV